MQIQSSSQSFVALKTDVLLVMCSESYKPAANSGDPVSFFLRQVTEAKEFSGKKGDCVWIRRPQGLNAGWLAFFGLGKLDGLDSATRMARIGAGIKASLSKKKPRVAAGFLGVRLPPSTLLREAGLAAYHAAYRFDQYKAEPDGPASDAALTLLAGKGGSPLRELNVLGQAIDYAKDIANQPPNVITPPTLAAQAEALGRSHRLKVEIWDEKRLGKEGFGGILAVGSGSQNKPRFIRIDHRGGRKGAPPVCVVGKAITFDSGGISIKPSDRMDEMKFDKCGGVAVLGIMKAAASLKLKLNITGLIAGAENLPSSSSYRPGDLVKTLAGKYVEVLNTDAEGRIVLADALTYACRLHPRAIVDLATLTGACVVALGNEAAGMLSNNARLAAQLQRAADAAGERVWPMPLYTEFQDKVKSDIGFVKNTAGREGGTCTAAAFLRAFVDNDAAWAHLDIAGTAWTTKDEPHRVKGATGYGVALVTEWLRSLQ